MADQQNQSKPSNNPRFLPGSMRKETPDVLLTRFLCSGDIVSTCSSESPQQRLKEIMNDSRWTRRMLEDWFKKGPHSAFFSVTPDPEFRAVYLIFLSALEDAGKQNVTQGHNNHITNKTMTEEEKADEQRRFDERVSEHFDKDATWEQVDEQPGVLDKGAATTLR